MSICVANAQTPLSAIEWLRQNPASAQQRVISTDQRQNGAGSSDAPAIRVVPLDEGEARHVGIAPPGVTGLPDTLWQGVPPGVSADALIALDIPGVPAGQALVQTLVLSESIPSYEEGEIDLTLARIDILVRMGALDLAMALIEHVDPARDPRLFQRFLDVSLLTGNAARPCAMMHDQIINDVDYAVRIFCTARSGDWRAADMMLHAAKVLGEITQAQADILARFLDPDLLDQNIPILAPRHPNPLSMRLFEAVGLPISTQYQPRAYANLDLRDIAGWPAQLRGAERLARSGAIDNSRLMGILTARRPPASGGMWDRVAALQRLDQVLRAPAGADDMDTALDEALIAAKVSGMAVPVADFFALQLIPVVEQNLNAARAAFELLLLSARYTQALDLFVPEPGDDRLILAAALGAGDTRAVPLPPAPIGAALHGAFAQPGAADEWVGQMIAQGSIGPAIIRALDQLDTGVRGDAPRLRQALSNLRALGLEDTARRAALQVLLLDMGT